MGSGVLRAMGVLRSSVMYLCAYDSDRLLPSAAGEKIELSEPRGVVGGNWKWEEEPVAAVGVVFAGEKREAASECSGDDGNWKICKRTSVGQSQSPARSRDSKGER